MILDSNLRQIREECETQRQAEIAKTQAFIDAVARRWLLSQWFRTTAGGQMLLPLDNNKGSAAAAGLASGST